MGALALTGTPAKREPFAPLPGPVTFVPYGDEAALRAAVTDRTAAVFLEPTLGEGGVVPPPRGYLAAARGAGVLVNAVQPDAIRLAPPLILTAAEADEAVAALATSVAEVEQAATVGASNASVDDGTS